MEPTQTNSQLTAAADAPGELERLSIAISYAHDLASKLEGKLAPVVGVFDKGDESKKAIAEQKFHISALIDDLNEANARFESLLHKIVL